MHDVENIPDDNLFGGNCYIDVNGESIPVVNGYVTDPASKARTKLEFFYLSESEKMVHIDFEDALEEIRCALKHHRCRKIQDKVEEPTKDNPFAYVCQKLEDLNKKIDNLMSGNNENVQRLNNQRNESKVTVDVHRADEDTTSNISSGSELHKSYVKVKESSPHNNATQQLSQHSVTNIVERKDGQALVREFNNSEKSFFISADDLRVISQWASKNTSFLTYKGMTQVPVGTFETDDNYFIALLCSLNPTVVLEQLFSLDSQRPNNSSIHIESSGEVSQEEFAKYLGLTQRKTFENNNSPLHSKKLRSKSNLARQNNKNNVPLPSILAQDKSSHEKQEARNDNKQQNNSTDRLDFSKLDAWKPRKSISRSVKNANVYGHPNLKYFKDMKAQYTIEEDKAILNWVLSDANINKVNGNTIWQELENKQLMPIRGRTWQSLRNRYLKNILCQLREYGLENNLVHKIQLGAQKGTLCRKDKVPIDKPNYGLVVKKSATNKIKKDSPKRTLQKTDNKPELRSAKRKSVDVENRNVYSDTDVLSDQVMDVSYSEYKNQVQSSGKKPLVENPAYTTRSKGRKLFTQRTFVASMSGTNASIA